ncbi:MAG: glycoside hydrolase family 15 protein [Dichotomicrobium sp.]
MNSLNLGVIGNCSFGALVDEDARIVWCCLPRFDGDPVFHALLGTPEHAPGGGQFDIEMIDQRARSQSYDRNTAILRTRLESSTGVIEIVDFAPRFETRGRIFRPNMLVRRVIPVSGSPRIRVRLRPRFKYGAIAPDITFGSNHIRYVGPDFTMRLTTDAPVDYIREETAFIIEETHNFMLGPDETLEGGIGSTAREFEERTGQYWRGWVRTLGISYEWQEAVIRAAITLKLCTYEPTGAIIAAMTTSIPESPDSGRNWDYRFCWLRDAFFVVRALNGLSAMNTLEDYFRWLQNVVSTSNSNHLQPVFGVGLERKLSERVVDTLPGYRGMGPVRVGNQAHEHFQYDVYGNVVLGAAQAFLDARLYRQASIEDFRRLEHAGEQAFQLYKEPDAGMWELRSRARVHTSSSLMCWAACDRLGTIAQAMGETERARYWDDRAHIIKTAILENSWNDKRRAFVESFGGQDLDASVLLMGEVGFIDPQDSRFISTVEQLEKHLGDGPHMRRYEAPDDFGRPETAFNICAFWRIDALARIGRKDQAREIFETLLASRNHLGLLSEDVDPRTGELWGNFPQTYSMVGIINGATRLSRAWESVL